MKLALVESSWTIGGVLLGFYRTPSGVYLQLVLLQLKNRFFRKMM